MLACGDEGSFTHLICGFCCLLLCFICIKCVKDKKDKTGDVEGGVVYNNNTGATHATGKDNVIFVVTTQQTPPNH